MNAEGGFSFEEIQLATRNKGMPLEGLRYDVTPVGMHYTLVHFDIPFADSESWRLSVGGNVERPLSLTVADLRARPSSTFPVTLECAGNGRALLEPHVFSQPWVVEAIGTAEWTGTPLAGVLADSGIRPGTVEILFTGADRGIQDDVEHDYQRALSLDDAIRDEVMLVYEMNGRPLEPQHGFPLRLIVPGWYGMTSVKWLKSIDAITEPFDGYQQAVAYRYSQSADEPGEPVTRMRIRALMIPPGIPYFPARHRLLDAGAVTLEGRAWCGSAPVERVEVCVDGVWSDAELGADKGRWAWRGWSYTWDARPGEHTLSCRASDADGNTQPLEQSWNVGGFGNNLVQEVGVTVR